MLASRIRIIVPYFGKLPKMFHLWLLSASCNADIEWLIITDDRTAYEYPPNVGVLYMTWSEVKRFIAGHLSVDTLIKLENPWDLCALRPAYGEIFSDYIGGCGWWGYCDLDMVFGAVTAFISSDILDVHDKILWLGHLSLYRNVPEVNSAYLGATREGEILYERAFAGKVPCFDEDGINNILENLGKKIFRKAVFADFEHRSFLFRMYYQNRGVDASGGRQVFTWCEGDLHRHYIDRGDGRLVTERMMYIHFCRRPMSIELDVLCPKRRFAMVPNRFVEHPGEVTKEWVLRQTRDQIYWAYWLPRVAPRRIAARMREFLR